MNIGRSFRAGRWRKEKKDRTAKTSQKGYTSSIWGEAPTQAICIENCVVGKLIDDITCAKFQNEIFRGYHFTGGRIFRFLIDIWLATIGSGWIETGTLSPQIWWKVTSGIQIAFDYTSFTGSRDKPMSCSLVCAFTNDGLRFRNPFNVSIQNTMLCVFECQQSAVCAYVNLLSYSAKI